MRMDESLQQIGARLRGRRKQLNLTQDKLAELANVTSQTISMAERGKKAMRADTIVHVCCALSITPNYLLLGDMTEQDTFPLSTKLSQLTPEQYCHLEDIINSYIAAVSIPGKNEQA